MAELFSNLGLNAKLLAAQVFNFLLVLWLLNRFVFKRLIVFLEERKERIEKGLVLTEKAEQEMSRVAEARKRGLELAKQEAFEVMVQAKSRAELGAKELENKARVQGEQIVTKAMERAKKEQSDIVINARREVHSIAVLVAERVLERSMSDTDEERLLKGVTEYLEKEYVK